VLVFILVMIGFVAVLVISAYSQLYRHHWTLHTAGSYFFTTGVYGCGVVSHIKRRESY
ncbi:uncharacterized protein METZ01_LOCUS62658, partial [marine metagenome]